MFLNNLKNVVNQNMTRGNNWNSGNSSMPQQPIPPAEGQFQPSARNQRQVSQQPPQSPNMFQGMRSTPTSISFRGSHGQGMVIKGQQWPMGTTEFPNRKSSAKSGLLNCYFGCNGYFRRDYDLRLHLKFRHRNEHPDQLKQAYQAADDEIELTKRSGSTFQCAICGKTATISGTFYNHVKTVHNMAYMDYREQYGRCEVESAPFECRICGKVIKYDCSTITNHLKCLHGLNWESYLERVRTMQRGEIPEDLPQIETFECKVCNTTVKYLRDHLRRTHKISEDEYDELIQEEQQQTQGQWEKNDDEMFDNRNNIQATPTGKLPQGEMQQSVYAMLNNMQPLPLI